MKNILLFIFMIYGICVNGQEFEKPKSDGEPFTGLIVKVGGDFALQLQSLDHSSGADTLYDLVTNFNLPTANLNLDIGFADGLKLYMRTYLSSRHHNEAWVKGGYLKIDKLDFIHEGFLSGVMDVTTVKLGMDEINYGDAHFRRSDNAMAIHNPFVGNYIMDAFTTEVFGEILVRTNGIIAMIGLSNGKLNQNVTVNNRYNGDNKLSFYGKLGYDNQPADDLRLRLTGSWYLNSGTTTGTSLYGGDRSGSRYYSVMVVDGEDDSFTSGRFNPRFAQITAFQVNPFVSYKGLEFFGIFEKAMGGDNDGNGSFRQVASDLLYRFGGNRQFYLGGRYNLISGQQTEGADTREISRINLGGGWFITENILAKVEYVSQAYSGGGWTGQTFEGGKFNGIMFEGAISF